MLVLASVELAGRQWKESPDSQEAGDKIQTAMIIAAALIEGAALFGAVICLMAVNAAR